MNISNFFSSDGEVYPKGNFPKFNSLNKKVALYGISAIVALFIIFILSYLFLSAPKDFPAGSIVRIEEGKNLRNVSLQLKEEHIIRSRILFEAFVIMYGAEKHIIYSDYLFEKKLPVYEVARRISKGEHHIAPVVVTIPEGFNTEQIADTLALKLVNFDKEKFLSETKDKEGYLFPDTYFFFINATAEEIIKSMSENFERKIKPILPEIAKSGKTEREIIVMASIVEKEAKGEDDRGFIAGILWKRIKMGMALQVDAAPETYKKKGLPESPIGNPGIRAIEAAIHPENSPYLYYLHDKDGNIHYARTFSEHVKNKFKYLK